MKAIGAFSRDVWEVQRHLTDSGFKTASELLGNMPKAQKEAIVGACFTVYNHRTNGRGGNQETTLWQKIRVIELGLTVEELARAVAEFHAKDLSEQNKLWREKLDEWVQAQLSPEHYKLYRHGSGGWDFEARFVRQHPRPRPLTIKPDTVAWIESQRPHRENFNPVLVEIFERYFQSVTGYKLSWEQLHSKLESRDPRAKKTPIAEMKRNKKNQKREDAAPSVPVDEPAQAAVA